MLAAMLFSPASLTKALEVLEPDGERKFYLARHGVIYRAIKRMFLDGRPVDLVTVADDLEQHGETEQAGGTTYIHELARLVGHTANVQRYAEIVNETWARRGVILKLGEVVRQAHDGRPVQEILSRAEGELMDLRALVERGRSSVVSSVHAAEWFEEKMLNPVDEDQGVATPFGFLKRMRPGRLYVLGGYQKDGKTALSVQFLRAAAAPEGLVSGEQRRRARVGFGSMEMSWEDLTDRIVSSFEAPHRQVVTGQVSGPGRLNAQRAVEEMKQWGVDIIDDPMLTVTALRRHQIAGRYDYLIVDHLHRFDFGERRELERIVGGITTLAREFQIPVLLLAQLKRSGDPRKPFPMPTMASLRETGMIEAEAAAVWFIWRLRDDDNLPTEDARFVVAANRFGPPAVYDLTFVPHQVRFEEGV